MKWRTQIFIRGQARYRCSCLDINTRSIGDFHGRGTEHCCFYQECNFLGELQ